MAGQLQPLTISPSRSLSFAQNGVPTESSLSSFKAQHFEEFVVTLMPQMRQWMSHWCPTVPTSQFCPRTQFWPLGCHMLSYVIYIYILLKKTIYNYIYTRTLLILWDFWIHIMWCKSKLYCKFENVPVQKAQLPSLSQLLRWKASSSLVHDAGLKMGYMAILSALMGLQ